MDEFQCDVSVQGGRHGNDGCIEVFGQLFNGRVRDRAQLACHGLGLLHPTVDDTDEFGVGQFVEDACVVPSEMAHADHRNAHVFVVGHPLPLPHVCYAARRIASRARPLRPAKVFFKNSNKYTTSSVHRPCFLSNSAASSSCILAR